MKWNIVADSSCDIFELEGKNENIEFSTVPFIMNIDNVDYVDDENINVDNLVDAMYSCKSASKSACPSPETWLKKFSKEGDVIAITITSALSGSFNSAVVAKDMALEKYPDKKIHIIDSLSTGPGLIILIRKLNELISEGLSFEDVVKKITEYGKSTHTYFALSSFDNLVKNGRMHKMAGFVAHRLGLIGVGYGTEKGTIGIKSIVRGKKKALNLILNEMKTLGLSSKNVFITHCQNAELAESLKQKIEETWEYVSVTIGNTRGLCSFYAERHGIIVTF